MEKKKCDSSRVVLGLKNEDGNYFWGAAFVSDLNSSLIAWRKFGSKFHTPYIALFGIESGTDL